MDASKRSVSDSGSPAPPPDATSPSADTVRCADGGLETCSPDTDPPEDGSPRTQRQRHDSTPVSAAAPDAVRRVQSPPAGPPTPSDVIFVTGFGPFGQHPVNASWQVVSCLHQLGLANVLNVKLVTEEVPVQYEYVAREIPRRWRELRPRLVVHVGVSKYSTCLQLERRSCNGPYSQCDVADRLPVEQRCVSGGADALCTQLDLARTCRTLAAVAAPVGAAVSHDAGRYLCDFIYCTSLAHDPRRTVFVHVPPLDTPYTAHQLAAGLAEVVRDLYRQVLENDRRAAPEVVTARPVVTAADGAGVVPPPVVPRVISPRY